MEKEYFIIKESRVIRVVTKWITQILDVDYKKFNVWNYTDELKLFKNQTK